MTLLVTGGIVVTMDRERRVLEHGAVAIEGTRIATVGRAFDLNAAYPGAERIDATGHAILPGLIDGHAHAGHGLVKTLGNGNSEVWSEACRVIYTIASPPSFWRAEARLAALERLMFGVTTGVSLLGGGDSVMRTDRPEHAIAHHQGVTDIGIRDIMAVGPTRPPHPRLYADWNETGRHDRQVSFDQQLDTIAAIIEACHGKHRGHVATLMPVYRKTTHDPALVAEITRQGRLVRDLGRRHGTLFHQDGHRSGSLAMAETMFDLLGPNAFMSHCTDLTEADLITVDLRRPHLAPANMPIWRLVCFANGQDVETAIVDGQILMRNRKISQFDTQDVLAEASAETITMLTRTGLGLEVIERPGWGRVRG